MPWGSSLFPLLIVTSSGKFTGLFVYSPAPGPDNLVASITASSGTDPFGNQFLAGSTVYGPFAGAFFALQMSNAALQWHIGGAHQSTPYTATVSIGEGVLVPGTLEVFLRLVDSVAMGDSSQIRHIWLVPSGDTTGAADTANINAAFGSIGGPSPNTVVHLLAGTFYVKNTITIPSGAALIGAFPVQADGASNFGAGTIPQQGSIIQAVGAFTAGPFPAAVIQCFNSTATQQGGQVIQNISVNAAGCPAGSGVIGILLDGAVGGGFIDNVSVFRPDGACLKVQPDATSGFQPDQWRISRCTFGASRSSYGVQVVNFPDSTFADCLSHDNQLDNWIIGSSDNLKLIGCRGEGAHPTTTATGFHFTGMVGADQSVQVIGCSTQFNNGDGFLFDSTAFTALGNYILSGCRSHSDNQSGNALGSGFRSNGCKSRIVMTGCETVGLTQKYGTYEGSISYGMALSGCWMVGSTAATFDDATNTHALSNLVPVPF